MNTPEQHLAEYPQPKHLESMLSDGGRYYRTLLLPALGEGLEATPIEDSLLLLQLFFSEGLSSSDELFWATQMDCSLPAFREMKRLAIISLNESIRVRTGVILTEQLLEALLQTAGERERVLQTTGIEPEAEDFGGRSARTTDMAFQFVVTAGFLSTHASRLFGKHVHSMHWIRTPTSPDMGAVGTGDGIEIDTHATQVIEFKSVRTEQGTVRLIVSAGKQFYLAFTSQAEAAIDDLCIICPDALHGIRIPLERRHQPGGNLQSWAHFGFLDDSGKFVLSIADNHLHFEDTRAPISFSGFMGTAA